MLSTCDGNAEAAIDVVLSAGSPQEFRAQQAPMQQQQASTSGSGSNGTASRNAARDAAVAEQERMFALANSPRGTQQPPQPQPPSTTTTVTAGAGRQEMLKVVAPPGGAAGAVLSIKHNGSDFYVTVTSSYI